MTNENQASAVLQGDGTAVVTIDGQEQHIERGDDNQAMRAAIAVVADRARERATAFTVTTQDETGTGTLLIDPDGRVSTPTVPDAQPLTAPSVTAAEPALSRRKLRTARDFAETKRPVTAGPAETGVRGAINRLSGGSLQLAPSARELEERDHRAAIQRGLLGHKNIVFVNLKGGSSKTTCTYLVGATLGRIRGGNILAWDNNENKGTLGDRSIKAAHDHTAIDLLDHIDDFQSPANAPHLVNYVRPQGENKFHVLASQDSGSARPVIDGEAFTKLHRALRTFYHLILVDTGNASNASTWQAAVAEADEVVIVTLNREDSAKTAASTIDDLVKQGHADKLARGIAIITEVPTKNAEQKRRAAERMQRLREHLEGYVREVVAIPNDKALDDGDDILFERLGRETTKAFTRATAAIVNGL